MVVAVVAILFVGPKELPAMLRTFGRAVKKVRAMASDFQGQFDEALKDAELDGVKDSINQVRDLDPTKKIRDSLNPLKSDIENAESNTDQSTEFDPKNFSEDYGNDVEAQLDHQDAIDAASKVPASSGKNAVPGFGTVDAPTKAKLVTKKRAGKEPAAKKAETQKPAAKKAVAKKPAAQKAPTKKSIAKLKTASKASATKSKPATKRKPVKKTDA